MSKSPYPGYPPSYKDVTVVGGYYRTCLVIELISLDKLSGSEIAVILEKLEATIEKLKTSMVNLEKSDVVTPDRFDPILRASLRL